MTSERQAFWNRQIYATRRSAHLVFVLLVWPLVTLYGSSVVLLNTPYVWVSISQALQASLLGLAMSLPDLLFCGTIFCAGSALIFARFGPVVPERQYGFARLILEPLLTFTAILAGISISYPAVLSTPILAPLWNIPAAVAILILMALTILGAALLARPGKRLQLSAVLVVLGLLSPAPLTARAAAERYLGHRPEIVVLGLDSVSVADDVELLRRFVADREGTWFEYAVAPGLLTNAVWSSILTMAPVSTHRVFHTFERFTGDAAFLKAAQKHGYHTVSMFPDQLTASVGSRAGFAEDRSGAVGWRQVLLPTIANSSVLLPIVKPVLPRFWPSASPPNQAGTFTYDLRRDVRAILRAGSPRRRTLVAAHLTYTHLAAYPPARALSWSDLRKLAVAKAGSIEDRSFDWQDEDKPTDPFPLQRWKLRYLQQVLASEIDSARYLEGGRRLVIFSDHGHRRGLNALTFQDERFHHVLLAVFGNRARCPQEPISLIDIGSLIGISDRRAPPVLEFAITPPNVWSDLMNGARLRWAGDVDLDAALLAEVLKGLQQHRPWSHLETRGCDVSVRR